MHTVDRADELFAEHLRASHSHTDRVFAALLLVQALFAVVIAVLVSPYGWAGKESAIHLHVPVAIVGGVLLNSLPLLLVWKMPGAPITRYVIAVAQMMWSGLLVHLTGGRIETHFHVFGSLAFLAFYRDWKVLVPATVVVAGDHLVRQLVYPESVYGILNPEWWRFLEHAGWVVFEDIVLVYACLRGTEEVRASSERQAQVEALSESVVRTEKLAAVGQLAASVGHELRNPLAAVQNAHTYIARRIAKGGDLAADARVAQFSGLIDKEIAACNRIISDLLDFARERQPALGPCPLRPLVEDALSVVPRGSHVVVVDEIPDTLPVPSLDPDQFRQVIVNLVQNAVEALGTAPGRVRIRASGGDREPWRISVEDNGPGMLPDVVRQIFQPLYTTKTKGTGLGLAIVSNIVQRHGGGIVVRSEPGKGTTFEIELPAVSSAKAA